MTQPSTIPAGDIRGVASGVLFMAFFGTLWASIGIGGLQGWGGRWPVIGAVLIWLGLLLGGISLLLASRRLSNQVTEADAQHGKRTSIWFGLIFVTEGLFIGVASGICRAINRFDLFFPIMAIIVGIHFLPLAALFHVKSYYLVGALLCLLALITLLAVPQRVKLGGQQMTAQSVVLGFGAAVILWVVGVALGLLGKRLLAQAERTEAQTN